MVRLFGSSSEPSNGATSGNTKGSASPASAATTAASSSGGGFFGSVTSFFGGTSSAAATAAAPPSSNGTPKGASYPPPKVGSSDSIHESPLKPEPTTPPPLKTPPKQIASNGHGVADLSSTAVVAPSQPSAPPAVTPTVTIPSTVKEEVPTSNGSPYAGTATTHHSASPSAVPPPLPRRNSSSGLLPGEMPPIPQGGSSSNSNSGKTLTVSIEFCNALELLFQQNRHAEAMTVLSQVELQGKAAKERQRLAVTRLVDDELEAAICHRDAAREFEREAADRDTTLEFLAQFVNIRCNPLLIPSLVVSDQSVEKGVAAVVKQEGSVAAVLRNSRRREALHLVLLQASQADERDSMTQASTPYEALLVVTITELCRQAFALCCQRITDDISTPHDSNSPTVSNASSLTNKSFTAARSIDARSRWEMCLVNNLTFLRGCASGRDLLRTLGELLLIAKHLVVHKVSEDIQAGTSLLMAELLSLYDRICPLPATVRKPSSLVCPLSGIRLDGMEERFLETNENGGVYYGAAARLYRACVDPTLPPL